MKSTLTLLLLIIASPLFGQEVDFVEYDLENDGKCDAKTSRQ
jgi:hypothetical protein